MPTPMQYARAAGVAAQRGDAEAAAYFRQKATEGYAAEAPKATEGMSGMERFKAGVGQGAVNVGRQIGRLVGQVSPEQAAEARRMDEALLDTGAGRAGSFVGEALATAPVGGVVASTGRRLGANAVGRLVAGNIGQGAAEGALMSDGDRLRGAAAGAAGAAIVPWLGGKALRGLSRGVAASAPARRLMREGVDLTPGQMNPRGTLGQLEEATTNLPGIGPAIQRAREASVEDWRKVVMGKVGAPGTKPGNLDSAYASFEPAYAAGKGFPTSPSIVRTAGGDIPLANFPQQRGAFASAARDRSVLADDAQRKAVDRWLQNKLTQLPGKGRGTAPLDSADLLKLRSDIRTEARALMSGANPDEAKAKLLQLAERRVTDALESQLPPDAIRALRAADMQYSQYKVVEDAMRRAGDQTGGMSPSHLSASVRAATPAGVYARGGGGPLRQLAASGKQVFDARTPPTGARLATVGGLGVLVGAKPAAALAGAATLAATTKAGRKALAGGTKAQQRARALETALRRKAKLGGRQRAGYLGASTGAAAGNEMISEE